jgi:hypothetical protein
MTILLACNADGSDKITPLVIGKSKNPRCFKNVRQLPAWYEANKKSWMTASIILFSSWLIKLNSQMKKQDQSILDLLFMNNATCHSIPHRLTNVTVHFLPKNVTSIIQSLDQGLAQNMKHVF